MKRFSKQLSLVLVIILLCSYMLASCKRKDSGDDATPSPTAGQIVEPTVTPSPEPGPVQSPEVSKPPEQGGQSDPWISSEDINKPPSNVSEFLDSEDADAGDLLDDPNIAEEILNAEDLGDLVDSPGDAQRLEELIEEIEELIDEMTDDEGDAPDDETQEAVDALEDIRDAIEELFADAEPTPEQLEATTELKGTWTEPNKVILRWTPQIEWLPEDGYYLYKIIDGVASVVDVDLGTKYKIQEAAGLSFDFSPYVVDIFNDSVLDTTKLSNIGVASVQEFNDLVFSNVILNESMLKISGADEFSQQMTDTFTRPASIIDKVPATDIYTSTSMHLIGQIAAPVMTISQSREQTVPEGPVKTVTPALTLAEETIQLVLDARNSMLTLANTDPEFASAIGFGYEDDFGSDSYASNTVIEYVLLPMTEGATAPEPAEIVDESSRDGMYSLKVSYGAQTPIETPEELQGYGYDGEVHLRWKAPESDYAKSIISGYYIERKLNGETDFSRINDVPVAISYMEDENNILYEVADYYIDYDVQNGDWATYRVQALDIFGRVSEYNSEPLTIEVVKTVAPGMPELDQPTLSNQLRKRTESYYADTLSKYPGETGVILPITKSTHDTESFIIYRSTAWGTGLFSEPEELGRISIPDDVLPNELMLKSTTGGNFRLTSDKSVREADAVFYDINVTPGYYYKYWVSAVDSWGNESPWSNSKVLGYSTENQPMAPTGAQANMTFNILPDISLEAVGFMEGRFAGIDIVKSLSLGGSGDDGPVARTNVDLAPVQQALSMDVQIGMSLSDTVRGQLAVIPQLLSLEYGNMPEPRDVHDIIALLDEDVLPNGTAEVSWYHYAGDGLAAYNVFRAYADGQDIEEIRMLSVEEIIEDYSWNLVEDNITYNQVTDVVEKQSGRIYLYMVAMVPEEKTDITDIGYSGYAPAGWINLTWQRPDDLQISHFRVYKAEVPYFSEGDDMNSLDWTMVGDNINYSSYTEEADQTHAHYYYFKITSVSIWGVETDAYAMAQIRVASTVPPQAPTMLIPFPQKGSIEVRWMGVPFASEYKVFRTKLPRVTEEDIEAIQVKAPAMFDDIFKPELSLKIYNPELFVTPFSDGGPDIGYMISGTAVPTATVSQAVSNFNTLQLLAPTTVMSNIQSAPDSGKVDVFNTIVDKYGILAVSPYGLLDAAAAKLIQWDEVHVESIPLGQLSTGEFSFVDTDVDFGDTYMYTVQAWNDDNLGSERPEPVSCSPRKGEAFPPVTGVSAQIDSDTGQPEITWNAAKDPNLSVSESAEFVAGYIVYRSKTQNGEYYQASPFLTSTGYIDHEADPAAVNWYKIKVVDIGGYTSDFSSAVSAGGMRTFILPQSSIIQRFVIPDLIITPIIPLGDDKTEEPVTTASTDEAFIPIITMPPIIIIQPVNIPETIKMAGFDIINVVTTDNSSTPKKGTGELVLANKYTVPVNLSISTWNTENEVTDGSAQLQGAVQIGNTGVYISSLDVSTQSNKGIATGYVLKAGSQQTENLIGDLYSLRFKNSEISPGGVIKITEIPEFRYDNIKMSDMESITVNLNAFDSTAPAVIQQEGIIKGGIIVYFWFGSGFINMMNGTAENDLGMETMDNKGLVFSYDIINFDRNGELNGTMRITETQMMRTVIPAGLGIKTADAKLVYSNGVPNTSQSYLNGKVMLPFDTFVDDSPVNTGFLSIAAATLGDNAMDKVNIAGILDKNPTMIQSGSQSLSQVQQDIVDVGMYYVAERAQEQTLLLLPLEVMEIETMSHIPVNVTDWDGRGFTIRNKSLVPTLVGQDDEEIGVIGSNLTIDLDREATTSDATTAETMDPVWTGMIIKSGRVSLPPAFIKTEENKRVSFTLTPGEMLYDRNGFAYQSQAYSPEGIPVNFGDQLGNFEDVYANSIYIDLYNNEATIEIKASVGIPLFGFQRIDVTLYTSEELGKLVCSVDETEKFDPAGTGEVLLSVTGGHLLPDGFHMDGTLDLQFSNSINMSNIAFTELIIPSDMEGLKAENNPDGLLGSALFDKPYKIQFHDFDMEIRALSLTTRDAPFQVTLIPLQLETGISRTFRAIGKVMPSTGTVNYYATDLFLWGGMQLSDTLAIDTEEDFDRVVIAGVFEDPVIKYEESKSKVDMEFEEFAQIDAVATPKLVDPSTGIIEYETETLEMVFNSAMDAFASVELECNARLGYDKVMSRFFFALALYYNDPSGGIRFAYGNINDLTGVIGYNLDIQYSEADGYYIPDGKQGLFNYIDDMEVNRDPGGNYFFAASAYMYLGYDTGAKEISLGEVRNMYLIVEKGPNVEMGGKYYGPSGIKSLVDGTDLKHMGTVRIGYYHKDRLFKFSLTLNDLGMFGLTVNGDVGFDMSPKYWELRIGYPNALTAELGSLAKAGFGLVIHNTFPPADNYIKSKMFFQFDTGYVTIAIVYFRAYLDVGAEGEINFNDGYLYFHAWIKGGLEGGIKVGSKRYEIISLHLDAQGELEKRQSSWRLEAKVKIRYHLNLFLFDVGGSVTWHMKLTL